MIFSPPMENGPVSGNSWGTPHNESFSCGNSDIFLASSSLLDEYYDPLKQGGHYAVLIGDMRKNGELFLGSLTFRPWP